MITPEQIADEEARAQLWREQTRRRAGFQQALWFGLLAGDPAAALRVRLAYQAIVLWQLERDQPALEPEEDPELDPLGISDSVNVGR